MEIKWKQVTWYSQALAIVLFVGVFFLGLWLGHRSAEVQTVVAPETTQKHLVSYTCKDGKALIATYGDQKVEVALSDGRLLKLLQTISGSGIRYANDDESIVFWSKGKGAFVMEGDATTYEDCVEAPIPV